MPRSKVPDGSRRRLTARARRDRLEASALEVFAARGYDGASMAEIARAAGITPAVIYDHFGSKAELHAALLEQQADQLLAAVATAVLAAPPDAETRLRAGVSAFFTFVEEQPFAWRTLFRDPPADAALAAVHAAIQQRATDAIAASIRDTAPPALADDPIASEMFAVQLKTAQNGLAGWWYEHRDVDRETIVESVMALCWSGLQTVARAAAQASADPE